MKLSEYLLDRIFSLICMLVAALVLLALLWLIETPAVFILFAEVILLAAYSTALLYDFFRKQSFYNLLQKMTEQMDKNSFRRVTGAASFFRGADFGGRSAVLQQISERPACLCRTGEP